MPLLKFRLYGRVDETERAGPFVPENLAVFVKAISVRDHAVDDTLLVK